MTHLLGFILAIGLVQAALMLLDMPPSFYFDDVAILIVFGGTLSAAVITFPMRDLVKMVSALFRIAKKSPEEKELMVKQIVELSQASIKSPTALVDLADDKRINPFLRDGVELMMSGFSRDDLETIMSERLYRDREREEAYGGLLRTISKYPPAFGLTATVLGLVSVMRSVATGADATEIGLKMGLALVATLYGLVLTNVILVPMSENLLTKSASNMAHRELMLEGMMMIYDRRSPLVIQEMLNSYLPPLKRHDILGVTGKKKKAAA